MKICYFGIYDPSYCRNKNLIQGLKDNGVEVLEVNDRTPNLTKYWKLIKKHWQVRRDYDLMIVGFCGQIVMPLARLISNKPIIFDAHISLYDANINQKQWHRRNSIGAWYYFFLDWLSCRLADAVLLDTKEHIKYFAKTFKLPASKFLAVYNGTDNSVFTPCPAKNNEGNFIVEFHAYVTLLHGLEYIIEAMRLLQERGEKVELWCVTGGPEWPGYEKLKKQAIDGLHLDNIRFIEPMPAERLRRDILCNCDIGLGIFGETEKVDLVIPNKLYELMACGLPVISAATPAVREQFEHLKDIYLVPKADAAAIADAIIILKNDKELRQMISAAALAKINNGLNPSVMAANLLSFLKDKKYAVNI